MKELMAKELSRPRGYIAQLQNLDLSGSSITDEDLHTFAEKNDIRHISLRCCQRLSSEGMATFFLKKQNLLYISLEGILFVDANVSFF